MLMQKTTAAWPIDDSVVKCDFGTKASSPLTQRATAVFPNITRFCCFSFLFFFFFVKMRMSD